MRIRARLTQQHYPTRRREKELPKDRQAALEEVLKELSASGFVGIPASEAFENVLRSTKSKFWPKTPIIREAIRSKPT